MKINYNRCETKQGGTFIHRFLNDLVKNFKGSSSCPMLKGNYTIEGSGNDQFLPPVPRIIFSSGSVRFYLSIFTKIKTRNSKTMVNCISFDIFGIYEK